MKSPTDKGARFERLCCKRLSLWVTDGKRDDCFWRSSLSGGRASFQLRQDIINRAQAGAMTAIAREGMALCERYLFEYKHRKDLNFTALITHGTGLLAGFWRSTQNTAVKIGKLPVLIAKQNHYPAVVLCPIGCGIFSGSPKSTLHELAAELHWFEPATQVIPPQPSLLRLTRPAK